MDYSDGITSIHKGRLAEAKVIATLVAQGWEVYLPTFGNGRCDLIALKDDRLCRIETKHVSRQKPSGAYEVGLRQIRANRVQMLVKKFNASNADVLAVYIAPLDEVVFFDALALDGRNSLTISRELMESHRVLRPSGRLLT